MARAGFFGLSSAVCFIQTNNLLALESIMRKRNTNLAEKDVPEDDEPRLMPPPPPSDASPPVKISATHLIHRAEQCAADIFARIAAKGQLTPRQYAILVA